MNEQRKSIIEEDFSAQTEIVGLCEIILSDFVVLWGMCLFLGDCYIIIRES